MSSQRQQRVVTNRRQVERAPTWIIPDDFVEWYDGGDTVEETLMYAHKQADTTTPEIELPRCRRCSSVRISPAPGYDAQKDYDAAYVCTNCRWNGDDPARPGELIDEEVSAAVRMFEVRCCLCNWRAKAYLSEGGLGAPACKRHLGEITAAIEGATTGQ